MRPAAAKALRKQVRGRPFPPGKSGNPAGKKKGAKHRLTIIAEALMEEDSEAVVRTVIRRAKRGDMTAARLILERIAPARKGRPVKFDLPKTDTASDLCAAFSALLTAVAKGDLTPDEASLLSNVFAAKVRIIETGEFEKRLKALEETQ